MELREDLELSWWGQPAGTLRPAVRLALVLACIATVILPLAGARVLWLQGGDETRIPELVFDNGLAGLAALAVCGFAFPKFRLSRYVRLAVLLPLVHLALIAVAWPVWLAVAAQIGTVGRWYYLARDLPLSVTVISELVIVVAAAALIARCRRDTGVGHAFIVISLVDLLLLGLWLPIVSWLTCHGSYNLENDPSYALDHATRLTALVIVPPLFGAIGYAAYTIGWPEHARSHRTEQVAGLVMVILVASGMRADAPPAARVVYANFIHVLLGAQILATAGPLVLGVVLWWRGRSVRRRLRADAGAVTGIVISEDHEPVIACFEITSWLQPPRPVVRSFVLATPGGEVPVHGARLVAPLDPSTTALAVGESYGALRAGDPITITSASSVGGETDPFRRSAAPVIGADPMIAPYDVPQLTFSDLALSLWRPAVAYLVILVVVAIPALAALIASPR